MRPFSLSFPLVGLTLLAAPQTPPPLASPILGQSALGHRTPAQRAAEGDAAAQFYIGRSYCIGAGVPVDFAQAAMWFRKAAEQGYVDAQCELGFLLQIGAGVPVDPSEALRWYRSAAERGHATAMDSLGAMYFRGEGTPVDRVRGFTYLVAAQACGVTYRLGEFEQQLTRDEITQAKRDAVTFLKNLHPLSGFLRTPLALPEPERVHVEKGDLEPPDPESPRERQAIIRLWQIQQDESPDRLERLTQLLKALAEQGSAHAQMQLGRAYEIGEGVPKDPSLAAQWYRKAAEQGYADAQYNLGIMYSEGDGVPKDTDEAQKWFSAAAASIKPPRSWSPAERLQHEIDSRGGRLQTSDEYAYRIFLIARNAGNPEAQALIDKLDKTLTKNQTAACRYYAEFAWVRIRPENP